MSKTTLLCACTIPAIALLFAAPAMAQVAPASADVQDDSSAPDIVVTGSLIRGTPEDAALPVDVIGADELARQGSPSAVELLKALPTSSGVLGDSNQFDSRSQGSEGIATVNLRGLSPQRSLVLLNSKRLATSGNGVPAVDINLIPGAAIGRIEVLKDGAAATYGSEAIAGVVNFITRTNQEGFLVSGSFKHVDDTDGDIDGSISYGHQGNGFRVLFAAGFQKRGQLLAKDREFAVQPYVNNPQGGWTGGGNPGNFILTAPTAVSPSGLLAAAPQPDSSCVPLGGYLGANNRCYTQYSPYDALTELEKRGQAFVDFEADLGPDTTLNVTALYGRSTVPHYLTSPSYILTQAPSLVALGGTNPAPAVPGFFVPASNPGFAAYRAANPGVFAPLIAPGVTVGAVTSGAVFPLLLFRPYLTGGNPTTLGDESEPGSARGMRKSESTRFTADLTGKFGDNLNWNLGATYHHYFRYTDGFDSFGDRIQLALRGLGGPNCNVAANTPGANGCLYLNPFGNAVSVNAATGATNPQANGPVNTAELTNWFFVKSFTKVDTEIFVVDASISGATGLTLPGGDVQFGLGVQYRKDWFASQPGANNNLQVNPCRESPINGNTNRAACSPLTVGGPPAPPVGGLTFLGTANGPVDLEGDVKAAFAELQIPVFDRLNIQLAARYEDYGGGIGSTFDPQARARLEVTDWLAFRGGVGTTFRAPTLANVDTGNVTALQLVGAAFKPVDIFGNPNLKPETSTNYSGGILLDFGGFTFSADYFRYELKDAIISDPLSAIIATLFPGGAPNTCATNTALAARITFNNGACTAATTAANVARVTTFLQNATSITNSGIDFIANYRSNDFFGSGARFGAGVTATYSIGNKIGDITVAGTVVQRAFDGVGLLNYQSALYPLSEWKGQAYIDLGAGIFDSRLTVNYSDGLHDQRADARTGPFAPDPSLPLTGGAVTTLLAGADINEFVTADFNLQIRLPWETTLTGTVINIFDAQPPFAREDYNYEPFVGNALGRQFKVGISKKF